MQELSAGRPWSTIRVAARLLLAVLIVITTAIFVSNQKRELGWERDVTAAYAFVVDHPEISRRLPCFCGCGQTEGHTSLDSCFVRRRDDAGALFQEHPHART